MKIFSRGLQVGKVSSLVVLLAAWGAAGAGTNVFPQAREASEYQIKAAFLYNFAKFIEWPPEKSRGADHPMKICIVGDDPFGSVLDESIKDKTIGGRRLVVQRLKMGQNVKDCQVAFISSSEKTHARTFLEGLKGASVLTVGDTEGFAALGGVINFTMEENRVRFEINVDAAERAHLKISSKLLSLARIVKE
jgi:YfiR/HmsC-like